MRNALEGEVCRRVCRLSLAQGCSRLSSKRSGAQLAPTLTFSLVHGVNKAHRQTIMVFQPFGNATVLPPAAWHPEPQSRGTFSILSSCLITMSLCIWTSLHLNVPEHGKEHLQKYRKLGWMILGLLAPELVLWNAWEQRKHMKNISALMMEKGYMPKLDKKPLWCRVRSAMIRAWDKVRTILLLKAEDLPELADSGPDDKDYKDHEYPWTDVHSWLVVMGGIALGDATAGNEKFLPRGVELLVLDQGTFEWIADKQPHALPDIPRNQIEDKSKSDALAKMVTCWQASYFCIQCIFRLSQQLSITLLELNVFAHAICALLLFVIWWDKPRDIQEPIILRDEEILDLCAWLAMPMTLECTWPISMAWRAVSKPPLMESCLEISGPTRFTLHEQGTFGVYHKAHLKVRDTYWTCHKHSQDFFRDFWKVSYTTCMSMNERSIASLTRAYRFERRLTPGPDLIARFRPAFVSHIARSRNSLVHMDIIPALGGIFRPPATFAWFLLGMTLAGACYGGLHLTAWAGPFPSSTQAILWRTASITVASTGALFAIGTLEQSAVETLIKRTTSRRGGDLRSNPCLLFLQLVQVCQWPLLLLWYTLCRTFLVVECFINMAYISEAALAMPTWSAYVPHIS